AGHVPVELDVTRQVAQLAPGDVAEAVGVAAGAQQHVLGTRVDAHAAVVAPGEVRLGAAVAGDVEQLEVDLPHPAVGVAEAQREVEAAAPAELRTFGAHRDRPGHVAGGV